MIIFVVICTLAAFLSPEQGQESRDVVWYSIVPPVLAISLAFLTRHVLLSLGVAVIAGGLLTSVTQSPLSGAAWLKGFESIGISLSGTVTNRSNLIILAFVPLIFIMIEVILASGGFKGIITWLMKFIKGGKSAQTTTALMGVICFIDDYANAIIVGSMMQPITDRYRISRAKLAFIVDSTSAPIAGLAVISTWISYETGLLAAVGSELGVDKSGYAMFFDALSYRFYCILMIVFVFMHILAGQDFGPMDSAEKRARGRNRTEENKTFLSKKIKNSNLNSQVAQKGKAINALIPLAGLIFFHIAGLWFDGTSKIEQDMLDWQNKSLTTTVENMPPMPVDIKNLSPASWIYWREVISNAQNSHLMLVRAALFGLILALFCGRFFGGLGLSAIYQCLWRGIKRAAIPIVILVLAWSLKNTCDTLETGRFLTTILAGKVSPYWFPPILFIVASVTSFATGTSYGTMAILIPTAIPVAFALDGGKYGMTTMISMGAVLDGAIFGDHCSPISDTTIMSSIGSSCDLMVHVRTQLPYSLFIAGLALVFAYVPSALGFGSGWSLSLAVSVMGCFFIILARSRKANIC